MVDHLRSELIARVEYLRRVAQALPEDYRGQRKEFFRAKTVELAVEIADTVIMEASGGTEEETNYLTVGVAGKFVEKVGMGITSQLRRAELKEEIADPKNWEHH